MSVGNRQEAEGGSQLSAMGYIQSVISHQPSVISCPFCHCSDVELFSLFGSQLLTSEYYCRNCRTVFEQIIK